MNQINNLSQQQNQTDLIAVCVDDIIINLKNLEHYFAKNEDEKSNIKLNLEYGFLANIFESIIAYGQTELGLNNLLPVLEKSDSFDDSVRMISSLFLVYPELSDVYVASIYSYYSKKCSELALEKNPEIEEILK